MFKWRTESRARLDSNVRRHIAAVWSWECELICFSVSPNYKTLIMLISTSENKKVEVCSKCCPTFNVHPTCAVITAGGCYSHRTNEEMNAEEGELLCGAGVA